MAFYKPVVQLLDLDGDGTASTEMAINVGSLGNATYDEADGTVDDVWTLASHGLVVGDKVQFSAVGTGATGYAISTDYWVVAVPNANEFTLAATKGGSAIEGTGDSGGTWTIDRQTTEFYIEDDATDELIVARVVVSVTDNAAFAGNTFGGLGALTNGVTFDYKKADDTVITDLTPAPIVDNLGWGKYGYDVDVKDWTTSPVNRSLLARWTFAKFTQPTDGLRLSDGCKLVCTINDDLSDLISFTVTAEGYKITSTYPNV